MGIGSCTGRGVTCTVMPLCSNGSPVQALRRNGISSSRALPSGVVVDAERREVVLDVAHAEADIEAATQAEVGDCDLLGQPDGVVEQREDDRDADTHR